MSFHFAVYTQPILVDDGRLTQRNLIVIKNEFGQIVGYTDFHKYIYNSRSLARSIMSDGNKRGVFLCQFLNYVFFDRQLVKKLTDVTGDMFRDFMKDYGSGTLPGDTGGHGRSKMSALKCADAVMNMLRMVKREFPGSKIRMDDISRKYIYRSQKGEIRHAEKPNFVCIYDPELHVTFRDMPARAFYIMLDHIFKNHQDILMLVALGAFAGLRPSEAVNVRRTDSVLGPGIIFDASTDGTTELEIREIRIDLTQELNIRSDLVKVGGIKKERWAKVYPMFIPAFMRCYDAYMAYIEGRLYEGSYGPLTITRDGKAMTYENYRQKIQKIARELIPVYLADDDPEIVHFGQMLQEYNIAPHIFRHFFTVQLVLNGEPYNVIQSMRGDKNPESALSYLQNKGELEREYKQVNDNTMEFLEWKAAKLFGTSKR